MLYKFSFKNRYISIKPQNKNIKTSCIINAHSFSYITQNTILQTYPDNVHSKKTVDAPKKKTIMVSFFIHCTCSTFIWINTASQGLQRYCRHDHPSILPLWFTALGEATERCWVGESEKRESWISTPASRSHGKPSKSNEGRDLTASARWTYDVLLSCISKTHRNSGSKNWDKWRKRQINMTKTAFWILHSGLADSLKKWRQTWR